MAARNLLQSAIESKQQQRRSFADYRRFVRDHYDGLPGALTAVTGVVTGHEALAGRLIRPAAFDVRGCKRILDAGCGNGRYTRVLLRHADADAVITSFDISHNMLHRARARLKSERVSHVSADLTRLPYPDAFFDAAVCGWVLEHLPDPRPGLAEADPDDPRRMANHEPCRSARGGSRGAEACEGPPRPTPQWPIPNVPIVACSP